MDRSRTDEHASSATTGRSTPVPRTHRSAGEISVPPATAAFVLAAETVTRFEAAWQSARDRPPDPADYLPDFDALRRSCLQELIRIDLVHRWREDVKTKRLSDYLHDFPDLDAADLPSALIYTEFCARRRSGDTPDVGEYLEAFPHQAPELAEWFALPETVEAAPLDGPLPAPSGDPDTMLDRIRVGHHLDDFHLLTPLGHGAFARVFLARQRSMQRLVAVKISRDHTTEPQTLARLDHDYIVRVFDQRLLAGGSLRLLFMEYLPGGTLLGVLHRVQATESAKRSGQLLLDAVDELMESRGELRPTDSSVRAEIAQLSWPETVAWLGRRIAEALDHAGRHGVLHRDIKPANVLLTAEGVPKLADFNTSFNQDNPDTTPMAYFGGSLSYMSPEQLEAYNPLEPVTAGDLDTRSDVYSLAVVMWELLTGNKPFGNEEAPGAGTSALDAIPALDAILERRRRGVSERARAELPADCPPTLERVLTTALAPNPADRWAGGAQLAQQLDVCLDPDARALIDPPESSLRARLARLPHLILMLSVLVPSLLAGAADFRYSRAVVSHRPESPPVRFEHVQLVVTCGSFAIGAVVLAYFCRYVLTVPRGVLVGRSFSPKVLARARSDTLSFGDRVVAVGFVLWVLAGVAYPLVMSVIAGPVPAEMYVHFAASLIVCGAIALAYPYFLVDFYLVRCIYPVLLRTGHVDADDGRRLRGVDRRSTRYLAVAASIPLIGVAGLTLVPLDQITAVIVPVRVLCIFGIVAFAGTYGLFRLLENDLRALGRIVTTTPAENGGAATP